MVKKKNLQTAGKTTLVASLLASAIIPYAAPASADTSSMTTAAEITTAVNALNATSPEYVADVNAINSALEILIQTEQAKITTTIKTKIANHSKAIVVVQAINDGPTLEQINAATEIATLKEFTEQITELTAQYTDLPTAARTFVKNYASLASLTKAITAQTTYLENVPFLTEWIAAVALLPIKQVNLTNVTADVFATYTADQKYTSTEIATVVAARAEYTKLPTTARKYVTADLARLTAIEEQIKLQTPLVKAVLTTKVAEFTALVTALDATSETYVDDVANANEAFGTFDENEATSVSTATKTRLANHNAATTVVTAIDNLKPALDTVATADAETVAAIKSAAVTARDQYTALLTTQRGFVKNIATLTALEKAITERETELSYAPKLEAWNTAVSAILDLDPISFAEDLDISTFDSDSVAKYTPEQLIAITAASDEYSKIITEALKYADAEKLATLVAHEKAAATQKTLQAKYTQYVEDFNAKATLEAKPFQTLVNSLPATAFEFGPVTLNNYTDAAKYTAEQLQTITEARTAYDELSDKAKEIAAAELTKLEAHEGAAEAQGAKQTEVVEEFTDAVTDLATVTDSTQYTEGVTALNEKETAFEALLTAATKTQIKNHRAAAGVVPLIKDIDLVGLAAIKLTDENPQTTLNSHKATVDKVTNALKALTVTAKDYVNKVTATADDSTIYADALQLIQTKQAAITGAGALAAFNLELDKLPETAYVFSALTYKSTLTVENSYTEAQKTLINTTLTELYDALSDANKTAVTADDFDAFLTAHSTALGLQETLEDEIADYALVKTVVLAFEAAVDALDFPDLTTEFTDLNELATDTPTYSDGQKTLINKAAEAHEKLVDVDVKYIDGNRVNKLSGFKSSLATQIGFEEGAVTGFKSAVGNLASTQLTDLTSVTTLVASIEKLTSTYTDFDATEKADLTAQKTTLDAFIAAKDLLTSIKDLDITYNTKTSSADIDTYFEAPASIRTAFNALDLHVKKIVRDVKAIEVVLANYEIALTAKKDELLAAEALATWTTEFNKVKDLTFTYNVTTFDYDAYTGFATAYSTNVENVDSAKTAYGKLTEANKLAEVTNYNTVTGLETHYTDAQNRIDAIDSALETFNSQLETLAFAEDYTAPTYSGIDVFAEGFVDSSVPVFNKLVGIQEIITTFDGIDPEFQAFIDSDTKTLIGNLKTSVADYNTVQTALNNKPAILNLLADWKTAFNAIKDETVKYEDSNPDTVDVFRITAGNVNTTPDYEAYEKTVLDAIKKARKAFNDIPTTHVSYGNLQDQVKATDKAKLISLEKSVEAYDAAWTEKAQDDKVTLFGAITTKLTALNADGDAANSYSNYLNDVKEVEDLVGALPAILVTEFEGTSDATTLANHQEVVKVVNLMNTAGTVAAIEGAITQATLDAIETKIEASRDAYTALSNDRKALLADTKIIALETALQKAKAIITWTVAYNVTLPEQLVFTDVTFAELDDVPTYTVEEKAIINGLSTIFIRYDATVQGYIPTAQITYFESLKTALADQIRLENAKAAADLANTLNAWTTAYNAIPSTKPDFSSITETNILDFANVANKYSPTALSAITTARDAYTALENDDTVTGSVLASINTQLDNLVLHEVASDKQVELQRAYDSKVNADKVTAFTLALSALSADSPNYVTEFALVKTAYEALNETLVATLTEAQATLYVDHKKAVAMTEAITKATAQSVLDAIAEATTVILLESKGQLAKQAKIDLDLLSLSSPTAKSFVKNQDALTATLKAIDDRKIVIENIGAIINWTNAYKVLPVTIDLSTATVGNILSYDWYSVNDLAKITALENVLKGYDSTKKALVPQDQKDVLKAYLDNVALYDALKYQAQNAANDADSLTAWQDAFNALPDVIVLPTNATVADYNASQQYAANIQELIDDAEYELTALSENLQKHYVLPTERQHIVDLKASLVKFAELKLLANAANSLDVAADIKLRLADLQATNANFATEALAIKDLYIKLSDEGKSKLTASELNKLDNASIAAPIVIAINDLLTVEEIQALSANAAATSDQLILTSNAMTDIRTQYNGTTTAVRSYVTAYSQLTAIANAITAKQTEMATNKALISWNEAVELLPDLIDLSAVTTAEQYSTLYPTATPYDADDVIVIKTARTEYTKLTAAVRNTVNATDLKLLVDLEADLALQNKFAAELATIIATNFTNAVAALDSTALDYIDDVDALTSQYRDFDSDVLAKISAATKTRYQNQVAAVVVVTQINAIALASNSAQDILAYKAAVTAARAAYTTLATNQRGFVKNLAKLAAHELKVKSL